jgi:MATE family multidrug resistance protein
MLRSKRGSASARGSEGGLEDSAVSSGLRQEIRGIGPELRPTFVLAGPVVLAELGWVGMGVVDTMIVGRLGAEAVGAVSLGSMLFFTVAVFGMGLLLGLDTLAAQAFGAGDLDGCHRTLVQGVFLAVGLTVPLMTVVLASPPWLGRFGVNPTILRAATPYIQATAWSTLPLLLYAAFRRYLQAMNLVRPVMFALISANLVNAVGNWVLVYGRLGVPALGVTGSGWATTVSRLYMALVLVGFTIWHAGRHSTGLLQSRWIPDPARLWRLVSLGMPAALHVTLEVGVFGVATALAARLDAGALAAHQIVLNVASVTFMIPFGLASTGAVRVGQAIGRGDPEAAARAGWTTLALGAAFMSAAGVVFLAIPRPILRAFTDDPRVLGPGVSLLFVAAGFQLFDGIQAVSTGNLRGTGDTRTAMASSLFAYWVLGLPVGYVLGFTAGYGVFGLWIGLALGLVATGSVLLRAWVVKTRALGRLAMIPQESA